MTGSPRLLNGLGHRKQRLLTMGTALLLVLLLTAPISALPPIQPLDPDIPNLPLLIKPPAPTNLIVTDTTSDTIDLAWTDNSANEEGFFIHRKVEGAPGFTTVGHVASDVTTFHNTGLTPETKYYYVITAFNSVGSSPMSNEASSTTPASAPATAPVAPTLLTAIATSDTRIDLSWQNNCTSETGFHIYRKKDGEATFAQVGDTGSGGWSGYGETGLEPGTKYYYYVAAYNAHGSADSNVLSATTTGTPLAVKPDAPSDLMATATSSSEITLIWKDNSSNESGFILERSLTQANGYAAIATLQPDSTSYDDSGLTTEATYFYRVKATNSAGDSTYSPPASATTQEEPAVQAPVNNNPPPAENIAAMVLRFYIDNPQYYINNTPTPMDAAPVIKESRTLLPIRFVATPLGAEVGWDAATSKVTITHNGTTIQMWIGKNTALVNGAEKRIDPDNNSVAPLIIPPGRTMLPLRFISENLGCQVDWNGGLREVKVTYSKP